MTDTEKDMADITQDDSTAHESDSEGKSGRDSAASDSLRDEEQGSMRDDCEKAANTAHEGENSGDRDRQEQSAAAPLAGPEKRPAHLFQPGQSGNPAGRPKGSRNKLGEEFVRDLQAAWAEHGAEVIRRVAETRPADLLKVMASILPKQVELQDARLGHMSDDELEAIIAAVRVVMVQSVPRVEYSEAEIVTGGYAGDGAPPSPQ